MCSTQRVYSLDLELQGPRADVSGRLWGGNLAMVVTLLGTPYLPRVRGGILFLEDVNEPAYKIERMLYQLAHAGVLQRQAAIVLGEFAPVTPMPNDNGFNLEAVIDRLRADQRCPGIQRAAVRSHRAQVDAARRWPCATGGQAQRRRGARAEPLSNPRLARHTSPMIAP